jgi:predicted nucleic acid-binding protein
MVQPPSAASYLDIAAHARSEGLTLVMHNAREFARVPALLVEDCARGGR